MNPLDTVILGILAISAIISFVRGFFREVLSLIAWVSATWIGLTFAPRLSDLISPYITVPALRLSVAFVVLFLLTLFIGAMVNHLIGQLVKKTGFTGTDRMIGVIFGLIRGGVIVAVLFLLAGVTGLTQAPWWQESKLAPYFQTSASWLRNHIAPEAVSTITYR